MLFSFFTWLALVLNCKLALSFIDLETRDATKRAAYFLQLDPAGDSVIVALSINNNDGTVSSPVRTPTGGKGLAGILALSQDSLVVSNNFLFAVNPGENTLSFFVIDPKNPTHPKLIGRPADTLGDSPMSVAYSSKLGTACVVNSGAKAGVTCYSVSPTSGLKPLGPLRPIPQTELNDPTPAPAGPLSICADIVFNPSSSALFVTVRSNGGQPGLLYAYPIENGQVSTSKVVSSLPTLPLAFSLNFLSSDSRAIITNIHLNPTAAFLQIAYPSLKAIVSETIAISPNVDACWVAYVPASHVLFAVAAMRPNITIVNADTGDIEGIFNLQTPEFRGLDTMVQRNWLYTLTDDQTDPKLEVFNFEGLQNGELPVLVQAYDLLKEVGSFAPSPSWMGLGVYPKSRE